MPDTRFHHRSGPFTLGHLAKQVEATIAGPVRPDALFDDVAGLTDATPTNLCLFMDDRFLKEVAATQAGALVTSAERASHVPPSIGLLIVKQPRLAFAMIGHLFYPEPAPPASAPHLATVDPTAEIAPDCVIGPGVVVSAGAKIGAGTVLGPNVVIGPAVEIGRDCRIGPNTTITHALIGDRVHTFSNVSIGRPGFGFIPGPKGPLRAPQLGRVVIGNDVEVGALTAIDRGALGDTVIGMGSKIDNGCQVAHNVTLGRFVILAGHVGIAGSAKLGDGVIVGGGVVISDHVTIGAGAQIAFGSVVVKDIEAGGVVGGYPAVPVRRWHRQTVALARLAGFRGGAKRGEAE
jgi:UDP-3-O-[3-hydroxymyristoyl] glucosamine N-acyltransferase